MLKWLGSALGISAALILVAYLLWSDVGHHWAFTGAVLLLYTLLTLGIFVLVQMNTRPDKIHRLSWMTMLIVLVKLVVGVCVIIAYHSMYEGDDIAFIAPFFITYVVFTVIEVILLRTIIQKSQRPWNT